MVFTSGLPKADLEAGESAPADYTSKPPKKAQGVELATRRILQALLPSREHIT